LKTWPTNLYFTNSSPKKAFPADTHRERHTEPHRETHTETHAERHTETHFVTLSFVRPR
jgi:hypothetical protein